MMLSVKPLNQAEYVWAPACSEGSIFASAKAMPYATTAARIMSTVATKPESTARASQPCRNVVCALTMISYLLPT